MKFDISENLIPFDCYFNLQPERFVSLGIEPPKGVLLYGPPGTGKTLCARAVANRTDACFIRVIGSELVQKYVGEVSLLRQGHMVRIFPEVCRCRESVLPESQDKNESRSMSLFATSVEALSIKNIKKHKVSKS